MPIIKTTCTRDCPDACGLHVEVEDGRVTSIKGAPEHPITRGFACYKQRFFAERVHGKRRVTTPLVKSGSGWREVGWREAIDLLASKMEAALERHGPLSIFHYQSGGSLGGLKMLNRRFLNLIGGGTFATGSVCGGAGIAGQELDFGLRTAHDPLDILNSKLIILWGRNPVATNVHLIPILREAKARGARIALIDPLPTETARFADFHMKPAPGTDVYLALALGAALIEMRLIDLEFVSEHTEGFAAYESMINKHTIDWLSRRCDVRASRIEELAHEYAQLKPASILLGWGVQRYAWGGETFRLIDALGALTGNLGIPGGGVSHGLEEGRHFDGSLKANDRAVNERGVLKARLGLELPLQSDPPVEVAIVTCANPAVQSLDSQAATAVLKDVDFLTVIDYEMTATAKLADLVLPSTTFLEENDVAGSFFHHYIGAVNRAIPPVGESKSDLEIFQMLAARLGVEGMEGGDVDWIERLLAPLESAGITYDALSRETWMRAPDPVVPFENGRFRTNSGRFKFIDEEPFVWGYDRGYPLTLLSTHPREWLHSEMTEEQLSGEFIVRLSPASATAAGLGSGDFARVSSRDGSFTARVVPDEGLRDDVIACEQGRPLPDGPNSVTPQVVSNIGANACYYQTRVRIEKV